jgi:peptidoglycan/LPS O-acetylase OafA/YrhL
MNRAEHNQRINRIDPLSAGIVVLTLATALIHFWLGIALGPPGLTPFPLLFYLNGLGYLVLLAALYLPSLRAFRQRIRWLLIIYTALTIVMWFVLSPDRDLEGYLDKALEGVLIVLLVIDDRRSVPGHG